MTTPTERCAAWDRFAAAALEAQLPSDGQPPVATDAVVCADAMLAARDRRFPPEPQPLGALTWDAQAEWKKGYEAGRKDGCEATDAFWNGRVVHYVIIERERIAAMAEEWARYSYNQHLGRDIVLLRFSDALREGAP